MYIKTSNSYEKKNNSVAQKSATLPTKIESNNNVIVGGDNIDKKLKWYQNQQYMVYVGWR